MKKVILIFFITSTFIMLYSKKGNIVYAKSGDKTIISEEVRYFETFYEHGQEKYKKQLNKKDYYNKVYEAKMNKERARKDKEQEFNILSENYLEPIDGGGTGIQYDVLIDGDDSYTIFNCDKTYYTYCKGTAKWGTESTYSRHITTVEINPNSNKGNITTKLIWDIVPKNRYEDLISVGWGSANLVEIGQDPYNESIKVKGKQYVEYDIYNWYVCDRSMCSYKAGEDTITFDYTYATTPNHFSTEDEGLVLSTNLKNDTSRDYWTGYDIKVTKIEITLSVPFVIQGPGTFKDVFTSIIFTADYVHLYDYYDFNFSASGGISMTKIVSGSISINPELKIDIDGHRLNRVQFYFPLY